MKRFTLALIAVCLLPVAAPAKDIFPNLPGVRDPGYLNQDRSPDPVCTSRIARPWPGNFPQRHGLGERVYKCDYGNVAVGSNRAPNLIEYRKFKERY
ncbi:MAG: hypothetical protein EON57_08605 [Alphaproteobacteria bacterium]|nr:MAG: hypothetical protein EON57_08605 [Alphaproteobacteria bacterium]